MKLTFNRISTSTTVLLVVIVISKLIGMLRDVFLANYYGTSSVSDAYLIAVSVPTLLFYFIGSGLSTAYLPVYNSIKKQKGLLAANRYSNRIVSLSMLISTALVFVLLLFPEIIVKVFAAGFDNQTVKLTSELIRISSFSIYFMVIINVWSSYLQSTNNFLIPGAISIPRNIMVIISIVISSFFGVKYLGLGLLAGYICEYLLLLPFVYKSGYRIHWDNDFKSKEVKETIYLVGPIIIGISVSQINKIVDKSIASYITVGGISSLNYASIINNAIQEVLVTAIITVLFAKCSAWVAEQKYELVKTRLKDTIDTLLFVLIPTSFGVFACARIIIKLILGRGQFDASSLNMTTGALSFYTLGLVFLAIRDTLVKVFYAYKNTRVTTVTSIIAIAINIGFNFLFSSIMGLNGLALATSISAVIHCIVLYYILHNRIGDFGLLDHIKCSVKSIFSSIIMLLILKFFIVKCSSIMNDVLVLSCCLIVGIGVYCVLSLILQKELLIKLSKQLIAFK